MNIELDATIQKLVSIRDDVDAIFHHQTDRIVRELGEVVSELKELKLAPSKSCGS